MHYLAMRSMCVAALTAMALSCAAVLARAEPVTQFPDTSRIVSIGGALTEIVYALGAEKMLVARDDTSLYPPEALKLKSVGYMRRLSPESVLSVNPSGILLVEGSGPPETLDVLKKASVPMVIVPDKYTAEGVTAKIEAVGKALGLEDKAKVLAEKVSADLDAVEKRVSAHNPRKRVLFILSMQGGRLMASGTGTAADGIIKLAGGVNVIDQYPGYKQLTDEAIEKANALPFGLAAYAFTDSAANVEELTQRVEAGNLSINTLEASVAETPFGGVKESGYGREGGAEGLSHYTIVKTVSHKMKYA